MSFSRALRVDLARLAGDDPRGRLLELANALERAGADALYLASSPELDALVALGAVAASSTRLSLGELASSLEERPPAILAKALSSLDAIAPGRARAVLVPSAFNPSGLGVFREALEIVRAMLRVPAPTLAGGTYAITSAWNEPRAGGPDPVPLAVFVPAAAQAPVGRARVRAADELFVLAARFADRCVVELDAAVPAEELLSAYRALARSSGRTVADLRLFGLVDARSPSAARLEQAGYAGVILDWRAGELAEALAPLERLGA